MSANKNSNSKPNSNPKSKPKTKLGTLLSRPVSVDVLPSSGFALTIATDKEERVALAQLSEIRSVEKFSSELLLRRWRKDGVSLKGVLTAEIIQSCVVSLEPINSTIKVEIDRLFVPENSRLLLPQLDGEGEIIVNLESNDPPDAYFGNEIDVWETLKEEFLLAIDPYARNESAAGLEEIAVSDNQNETSEKEMRHSPFAVLEKLKSDKKPQ